MSAPISSGLPRQDVPPRLINALEPGQLPPSCRRQRSVLGKTNRSLYQGDLRAEAITVILHQPGQQQRALSSLGVRRSGTPSLLTSGSMQLQSSVGDVKGLQGLSNTAAASMHALAARSLTPVLHSERYDDDISEAKPPLFAPPLHNGGSLRATPTLESTPEATDLGILRAAVGAPKRPAAALPSELRTTLLTSSEPLTVSSAGSVRRSHSAALDSINEKAVTSMQRFLRSTSSSESQRREPIDPLQKPYVVKPKLRQEFTDYHSTERITACAAGSGMFSTAEARFDAATRGVVGHSHVGTAAMEADAQRHQAVLDRIQRRTAYFSQLSETAESRFDQREQANIAKRAELKKRSADMARHTSDREARLMGRGLLPAPAFLPRY